MSLQSSSAPSCFVSAIFRVAMVYLEYELALEVLMLSIGRRQRDRLARRDDDTVSSVGGGLRVYDATR